MLTIGSLFSGIGGLELGLEWAGLGPVVWQVEQDDYCRRVLAKHWPDAKRYEDVRCVGAANLESVDVICGGFPCQDVSVAGLAAGIDGERSGLWSEYRRIIRELRPRYVIVENVAALLGRGFGIVLGDLAALGYDAEWSVLSACAFGATHTRERLFIVAYSDREHGPAWMGLQHDRQGAIPAQRYRTRAEALKIVETVAARVRDDDVPADAMDRVAAIGNAVYPDCSAHLGKLILAREDAKRGAP